MRQMIREGTSPREKCTRACAGSMEMRKLRGPLRVREACSACGGATLGGQVQTSWQAHHFCQVRLRFPGRAPRHATYSLAAPAAIACWSYGSTTSSGSKTVTSHSAGVRFCRSASCLGALFHSLCWSLSRLQSQQACVLCSHVPFTRWHAAGSVR